MASNDGNNLPNTSIIKDDEKRGDFIISDYEKSFDHLKFYDDRAENALKYLYIISAAIGSLIFSVPEIIKTPTPDFYRFMALLCIIVYVTSFTLILTGLQNRVYFVRTANHVNNVRNAVFQDLIPKDNYYKETRRVISWKSVHTYIIAGAILLSSLYIGLFPYALSLANEEEPSLTSSYIAFGLSFVFWFGISIIYWSREDREAKKREGENTDQSK